VFWGDFAGRWGRFLGGVGQLSTSADRVGAKLRWAWFGRKESCQPASVGGGDQAEEPRLATRKDRLELVGRGQSHLETSSFFKSTIINQKLPRPGTTEAKRSLNASLPTKLP